MLTAIHFAHAGRDAMLREAAEVWWPKIHREIVEKANNCTECMKAGKDLKCLKSQKKFGTIPKAEKPNEDTSLDFAGPFQNAPKEKKYMLALVDKNSGWREALFSTNPTTERVLEILAEFIAQYGIPQRIRTDPGTAFKCEKFNKFCRENFIKPIVCPLKDHRGNGKVERMIGTINERLRVDNRVVLEGKNKNLSRIFFAVRTEIGKYGKSAFECHKKQKPNTPKTAMVNDFISERDPNLQIVEEDFSPDVNSTVLIRERTRGSKLEETFAKRKAEIEAESKHTITILPNKGKMLSNKRNVVLKRLKAEKEPIQERTSRGEELPHCSKTPVEHKQVGKKRTVRVASTSTEEETNESGGEAIH